MKSSDVHIGDVIKFENHLFKIEDLEHKGTGQFGKIMHFKMRDVKSGALVDHNFKGDETVDVVELDHAESQYLYTDSESYFFMNLSTFEQFSVQASLIEDIIPFLREDMNVLVHLYNGEPVRVDFPESVTLKVVTAPPGVHEKDSVQKSVVLENGIEVLVPQFIKEGDVIKISTKTRKYIEKA